MLVHKWYCWVIGLSIVAAGITIPVAVFFTLQVSDACANEDTSTCDAVKGNCTNIESTWRCDCKDGYINAAGDTQTCEDFDECIDGDTSSCEDDKGNCVNMDSTWRCDCNDGYRNPQGDMRTCEDIDECVEGDTSSCEAGKGSCVNIDSTWRCDCKDGYRNAPRDMHTCEEGGICLAVDTSSCVSGRGYCINMESTWRCDCNEGYINPAGDHHTCEDIDECIEGDTSSCTADKGNCVNMNSTWRCDCYIGYRNAEGDMGTCEEARCGVELQTPAEEGTLEYPGGGATYYKNDQDCYWTLTTTPGKVLTLIFSDFHIEEDFTCRHDYLEIYDGWTMKDRLCGHELPGANGVYTTMLNEMHLLFHSDEVLFEEGFKLTWTSVENYCVTEITSSCETSRGECRVLDTTWMCDCKTGFQNPVGDTKRCEGDQCGVELQTPAEEGILEYPGGEADNYENGQHCSWTLTTTPGKVLTLTFSDFHIEHHFACQYDYLEIYDGSTMKDRFCGHELPGANGVYTTTLNEMRLLFHSDGDEVEEGFKLTWTSVDDHCVTEITSSCETSRGECRSLDTTWMCDCKTGFQNPDGDTKRCEELQCGVQLQTSAEEGTLEYPGGGATYYENDQDCSWTLTTTPGKVLTLTFSDFYIEYDYRCQYDYLEIYDGETMMDRFCGSTLPGYNGVYITTLYEIRLIFHSDESSVADGFKLTWTSD